MSNQARHVKKFRIKKGDTVQVIQGKESGKKGKVLRVLEADERIIVETGELHQAARAPLEEAAPGRSHRARGQHAHKQRAAGLPELRPTRAGGRAQGRRHEGPLLQEVQRPGG